MDDVERLISEIDAVLATAPSARRATILRRITDLFMSDAERYPDEQIAVFDSVIGRLIDKAERRWLAELSAKLAEAERAPATVLKRLSSHDDIGVSGPVLEKSPALGDEALAEICKKGNRKHILAIAGRGRLGEAATDALIERDDPGILSRIAANSQARISEIGFVKLINRAKGDKALAKVIAKRTDVPPELQPFLEIVLTPAA